MSLDEEQARRRFGRASVARLATAGGGEPHIVPVAFFLSEGRTLYLAVDQVPEKVREIERVEAVRGAPHVSVLADEFDADWLMLWWVRADGVARVLDPGAEYARAHDLLSEKYEQFRDRAPHGPVLEMSVQRWTGWSIAV